MECFLYFSWSLSYLRNPDDRIRTPSESRQIPSATHRLPTLRFRAHLKYHLAATRNLFMPNDVVLQSLTIDGQIFDIRLLRGALGGYR